MRIIFLAFVLTGCISKGTVEIKDTSKDTTFLVKTNTNYPVLLHLHITGHTEDSFKLNQLVLPGGNIDTTLMYDWYVDSFRINFKSYKTNKGELKIKYKL